jgi:hypothetical protein
MDKVPPFVQNSEDDLRCVNAVFRMISQELLGRDFDWEEIDALTKAVSGKATWTLVGETEFAKMGLKVKNIEPINYERLYADGLFYFDSGLGKGVRDYILNKTNIASVIKYIPEFLKYVPHETRRAGIDEIVEYLQEGKLVAAEVNSRILNKKSGLSLHFVLLYDFDGEHIHLHDPGLPPIKGRKVSREEFTACFDYEGANGEVAVFSRK